MLQTNSTSKNVCLVTKSNSRKVNHFWSGVVYILNQYKVVYDRCFNHLINERIELILTRPLWVILLYEKRFVVILCIVYEWNNVFNIKALRAKGYVNNRGNYVIVWSESIVQKYEKEIGASRGTISGNTTLLKEYTANANEALDEYTAIALRASGTWQYDDTNHTDYPFIEANLISGQRSYTFTSDENGNLILDVYKVMVKTPAGIYIEIEAVDQQNGDYMESFYNGENVTGTPTRYDKTANGIFLDAIPNYNWRLVEDGERGLKVFINRESSYFTYTDTTRKAGVRGTHHKFFYLRPALDYARQNSLNSYPRIEAEYLKLVAEIKKDYAERKKDEQLIITTPIVDNI